MLFASTPTPPSLFLLFLVLGGAVFGAEVLRISSTSAFISFSNDVNTGKSYSGSTVLLDSDIDFSPSLSRQFNPIGANGTKKFDGVFNGQGHTIKGLSLNLSSRYVGLFGYSNGATIKNVIIDDSCSFASSYISSSGTEIPTIGSVVGYSEASIIENIVNMGSVTFTGSNKIFFVGGILGYISGSVKNCVNYGLITQVSSNSSYVGGIVGVCARPSSVSIQNCANYGTLKYDGTTSLSDFCAGGILGNIMSGNVSIENCLSAGKISFSVQSDSAGSILGSNATNAKMTITNCFWTTDVGYSKASGTEGATIITSSSISLGAQAMNGLNNYGKKDSTWSKWFMLRLNGGKINSLNQNYLVVTQNNFPDPVKEGRAFVSWFKDAGYAEEFDPETSEMAGITNLYAQYEIKVTFDFGNGTTTSMNVKHGKAYGRAPNVDRVGYTAGWFTEEGGKGEKITGETIVSISSDHILYAHWVINTYTVTFKANGGTPVDPISSQYLSVIDLPKSTTKDKFVLGWWENESGEKVSWSFSIPAHDVVLSAVWVRTVIATADEFVEFATSVNGRTNYSGVTIYLDSDIDLALVSNKFGPAGMNLDRAFRGTFDGKGHIISNYITNSTSQYVGVFGYSYRASIKNVVIDDSSSIASTLITISSSNIEIFVGSVAGYCAYCTVENIVNMGKVAYDGRNNYLYLGGIIGGIASSSTIKNCVNYGTAAHSKTPSVRSYIGGVVGYCSAGSPNSVQNCANYGTIICDRNPSMSLSIGGIIGISNAGVDIENCVSGGKIECPTKLERYHIGGIIGSFNNKTKTSFSHCIWTYDVGINKISGDDGSSTMVNATESSFLPLLNTTVMSGLNEYGRKDSTWDRWIVLHLNGGKINNLDQEQLIVIQKHFPEPVKVGSTFVSWCKGAACAEEYDPEADITGVTELYAKYKTNNYTITFDFGNGTKINSVLTYDDVIAYPEDVRREEYVFKGWFPKLERMPARSLVVTAKWNKKPSEFVEIVFNTVDLTEENVASIIKEYVDFNHFVITEFKPNEETGEIRVIIKFDDKEIAEGFLEMMDDSSDKDITDIISAIDFASESTLSFSNAFYSQLSFFYFCLNN